MALLLSRIPVVRQRKRSIPITAWLWRADSPWHLIAQKPQDVQTTPRDAPRTPTLTSAVNADCERFIREHERVILNYLWRMTGDEDTAYDLAQEVFLRAWQRFEVICSYEQPVSWLFRVATNLALTHLKRLTLPGGSPGILDEENGPPISDPAGHFVESDQVRRILLQLSPQRRAALVLREVYGLSAAEVGHILGISDAAVRMALHRARQQFRDLYLREGAYDHDA